jgi:hypothetical protein
MVWWVGSAGQGRAAGQGQAWRIDRYEPTHEGRETGNGVARRGWTKTNIKNFTNAARIMFEAVSSVSL